MRPADKFVKAEMRNDPAVFCRFCLASEGVVVVVAAGPNLRATLSCIQRG